MSMRQDSLPAKQESGTSHQRNPRGPPSHNVPAAPRFAPPVPGSSSDEPSFNGPELALDASTPTSPVNRRLDDPPPVPQSAVGGQGPMTSSTRARPPPPPPPAAARKSTGDTRPLAGLPTGRYDPNEEETAAYEGDYDTDIAPTATHKAALKSHTPEHGHGPTGEETSGTHASSPTSPVARAPPPLPRVPPPSDQPKRVSDDSGLPGSYMPRAAPPPIPAQTQGNVSDDDEYDPYRYDRTPEPMSRTTTNQAATGPPIPQLQQQEDDEVESPAGITPAVSPPHQPPPSRPAAEPPLKDETSQRQGSSQQGTLAPSQPHDASKRQSMVRRSTDQGRPSMDSDYIATDVDLGRGYQWWTEANRPPPVFQNRTDVMFEMEESQTSKRGGKTIMSKEVYVLFQDYSQTIITARYDAQDANDVSLEQRHEPPPPRMRQDQLEMSHTQFGRRLAEGATAKVNNVVGDGTPHALVHELLKPLAGALMPVGTRAYGAMIYLNLANASVQQHDEIRSGDIVSFRNARFQGHRGPMHQKYSIDVGKPDHVGIVVDWDGTKKKVRAWEQGREGKKVKVESFKLGDLRSGEVKIWRVVGRSWVKWEN
ncbi:MAG: hypothetical protein M1823_000110 [Watsoniomyces obsoletus]|nr:MAG: hypothetical protein M1823_000110 [Watsoniomyces obsoletus]